MGKESRFKVLFVCMGNICRSPAAECVFRLHLKRAGLEGRVECDSAGTIRYHQGNPPDARMSSAGRERGIEIKGRARQITAADLEAFDLILAMDYENLEDIETLAARKSNTPASIKLFCEYCNRHDDDEVPDPYYGGKGGFERVLDLLEDGCANLAETIVKPLENKASAKDDG